MSSMLKLDWCSHEAARYACVRWHYSRCMPVGKLVKVGVWEDGQYIGCVIFSRGATINIGSPYGLTQAEVCELTRVALTDHKTRVSRILSIAIKFLKRACPGLRLIVSYADRAQDHHGGIYQATNWVYAGLCNIKPSFVVHGKKMHPKSVHSKGWVQSLPWLREHVDPCAEEHRDQGKHKYLMPLGNDMRGQVAPLAKPYPKRPKQAMAGSTGAAEGQHLPGRSNEDGGGYG